MEFRWLKGDWEFGKYKLQYRTDDTSVHEWRDVPNVELPTLDEMQGCLKGKTKEKTE